MAGRSPSLSGEAGVREVRRTRSQPGKRGGSEDGGKERGWADQNTKEGALHSPGDCLEVVARGRGDADDAQILTTDRKERIQVQYFSPLGKRGEVFTFDMWSLRCTWNIQVESQSETHRNLSERKWLQSRQLCKIMTDEKTQVDGDSEKSSWQGKDSRKERCFAGWQEQRLFQGAKKKSGGYRISYRRGRGNGVSRSCE